VSYHETGTDEIPRYRAAIWTRATCPWEDHEWIRFIHISHPGYTFLVLCRHCGRTPIEGLGALVVPS
jgi:hypothetical protein